MLGNIVDRRSDPLCPECDAVFEPSAHGRALRSDSSEYFSYDQAWENRAYFYVEGITGTTVRDAVFHAETTWAFAVTVFLYDRGKRPLGS